MKMEFLRGGDPRRRKRRVREDEIEEEAAADAVLSVVS